MLFIVTHFLKKTTHTLKKKGCTGKKKTGTEKNTPKPASLQLLSLFQFIVTVFQDRLAGDDSNERTLIIDYRNVVLVDCPVQKILHIGIGMYRFVVGPTGNGHDGNRFRFLDILGSDSEPFHTPQQITFGNRAALFSIQSQDGNTGKLAVLHFFQCLTQSLVFEYICHFTFGSQKK